MENETTHFVFDNIFLSRKFYRLRNKVEKYCTVGQSTDDNTAHAHCMLGN